jgi:N-acetylglucosamine kinase-like BadF-type ATPase
MFRAPGPGRACDRTSAMVFYLGIDAGGTKTRCALGDETTVLATSASGGSNLVRAGAPPARESLHAAVREVCAAANISPHRIRNVCVGAAGADRPQIAGQILRILAELTTAEVEVAGDMVIALESAFGAGPGVIAIAGTGSIVYGRDAAGHTARAGGWGFAVSDEGSGHWIGRRAVSAILHAHDDSRETALTARVLQAFNVRTLDELIPLVNALPPPEFPRLFPVVLRAAEAGDSLARSLLAEAGVKLAGLTAIVIRRLGAQSPHRPVAMTGSVFRQSAEVRQVFYDRLGEDFRGLEIRPDLANPVEGALARARKAGQIKAG